MEFAKVDEPCVHCWDDSNMRIPTPGNSVHKDECMYCFNTNHHGDGIFISMRDFSGVCREHLPKLVERNPGAPMVLCCRQRDAKKVEVTDVNQLGVEPPKEYDYRMMCVECRQEFEPALGMSEPSVSGIVAAISPQVQEEIAKNNQWLNCVECPHAENLVQLPYTGTTPPTSESKCANCECTKNNWMCLHCGSIGCPRKEAGGQEHAIMHFLITGHSVVVKLGTVTPGGADLHCYACDNEVRDSKLRAHLAHFGIDMLTAVKTAKTLGEMMVDQSLRHDYNAITEDGKDLVPLFGPGFTGLRNFGNTCYMASVLQMLFAVPKFRERVYDTYVASSHQASCKANPLTCYECQLEKLGRGVFSGAFALEANKDKHDANGVTPRDFKKLMTSGHRDFSTGEQQDAEEFLVYLLQQMQRKELAVAPPRGDPTKVFDFRVQNKTQCTACSAVRYRRTVQNVLSLNIPVEPPSAEALAAAKTPEEIEALRPVVSLGKLLEHALAPNTFECRCSECGTSSALYCETMGLETFPDFLFLHLRREYLCKTTYTTKKLDVFVDVPDELDLSVLQAAPPRDGEKTFKDSDDTSATAAGVTSGTKPAEIEVDELAFAQVLSMGIEEETAKWALRNTNNDVERAIDWVFSHPEGPAPAGGASTVAATTVSTLGTAATSVASVETDGAPRYQLIGLVSHIGSSALTGHYVAHLLKDGQWVIFNDEKVAKSQNPPKRLASIFLYRRI